MTTEELIDVVTEKTKGTAGDPLTRDEVAQIVHATINELRDEGALGHFDPPEPHELAGGGDIAAPE
jgi:nucleoid DNA-binding protein